MKAGSKTIVTALGCLLALAGCGSEGAKQGDTSAGDAAANGAAKGAEGWNAADACAILDKAAVADILKQEVGEAQLALVTEAGSSTAATSQCTYTSKDGAPIATLLARWSPINDNTPAAIEAARSATAASLKAFTDQPLEDVAGLGKAAFIAPKIDALNVFIDDARMIIVTPMKLPDGASGKDVAVALAKKAGA